MTLPCVPKSKWCHLKFFDHGNISIGPFTKVKIFIVYFPITDFYTKGKGIPNFASIDPAT